MDAKELINRFTYHAPHGDQMERYQKIRDQAKYLVEEILGLTAESREQALAINYVEQAVFWANAAIARREPPEVSMVDVTGGGGGVDERPAIASEPV
jgi:hypothetical protein